MDKILGHCGLDCSQCLAYKATVANSDEMRKQTAEEWSKMYNSDVKAEDVNCLGCHSDVKFHHCNICEIRTCGVSKSAQTCGHCDEYGCEKISKFFEMVPEAKENLDGVRER